MDEVIVELDELITQYEYEVNDIIDEYTRKLLPLMDLVEDEEWVRLVEMVHLPLEVIDEPEYLIVFLEVLLHMQEVEDEVLIMEMVQPELDEQEVEEMLRSLVHEVMVQPILDEEGEEVHLIHEEMLLELVEPDEVV